MVNIYLRCAQTKPNVHGKSVKLVNPNSSTQEHIPTTLPGLYEKLAWRRQVVHAPSVVPAAKDMPMAGLQVRPGRVQREAATVRLAMPR